MKVERKIISGKWKAGGRPCGVREITNFKEWEIGSEVTQDESELLGSDEITLWFFKHMKDIGFHC